MEQTSGIRKTCTANLAMNILLVIAVLVFTVFGIQAVLAAETGKTEDGFTWSYENGIMAVTKISDNAFVRIISLAS